LGMASRPSRTTLWHISTWPRPTYLYFFSPLELLHSKSAKLQDKYGVRLIAKRLGESYLSMGIILDNDGECPNPVDEDITLGRRCMVAM